MIKKKQAIIKVKSRAQMMFISGPTVCTVCIYIYAACPRACPPLTDPTFTIKIKPAKLQTQRKGF